MAENSKIEWTDHTFNPWIGCQKVSPGCDRCYAESLATRYGWVEWGQRKTDTTEASVGQRKRTSVANWRKPLQWAKAARGTGKRPRVFCASLADVFDNQVHQNWRSDLFELIKATRELDWLLLTKRPENIAKMLRFNTEMPTNVWYGTTCESQEHYDRRWPILREVPAEIHFISYEPAIGPLRIPLDSVSEPEWLICGGESGSGARMMDPRWASDIKADCERLDIAFFMKQMTGKKPIPPELLLRQFPEGLSA